MKYFALFVLMTIGASSSAIAQKCKYDYEKKDEFTGKMTKGTSSVISKSWRLGFNKIDNDFSLGLYVTFNGNREDMIHVGDTLMFAIEGGTPVVLTSTIDSKPTAMIVGSNIVTWYQSGYNISQADILKISQNTVTAVRVYLNKQGLTVDIPSKNAGKIQKAATCILN